MTTKRVRAGLRIPIELNTELILIAEKSGISKNALILHILKEWAEKNKPPAISRHSTQMERSALTF